MRELTVTEKDCAQQLIKYLSKYMEEAPKSFFYKMLRKKNIVLNQKKADGSKAENRRYDPAVSGGRDHRKISENTGKTGGWKTGKVSEAGYRL